MITSSALSAQNARLAEKSRNAEKSLPGHQREAPGSKPPPPRSGDLAVGRPVSSEPPNGDPFDPGHIDTHMWLQPPLRPRDFPVIQPITPSEPFQAAGSSITDQQDRHTVALQHWDAAMAAQSNPQPGNPSSDPHDAAHTGQQMHTAPSGYGQQFRQNGSRPSGNPYLPMPGEGNR